MKIFNFILAFLFALFAVVQYNDPDPLPWILAYAFVGINSLFAAYKKYNSFVLVTGIVVFIFWGLGLFPSIRELFTEHEPGEIVETMQATKPYVEGARESLGLFLSASILGFHFWSFRRLKHRTF